MFIGHFGAAFAAKRLAPEASLGTLFLAAQLADLVWPVLVLIGVETVAVRPGDTAFTPLAFTSYPYSHSLATVLGWAIVAALVYRAVRPRTAAAAAIAVGALVVSHWVLDWITHRPDLPIVPGGEARVGLGLWNSIPATLVLESAIFAAGLWLYRRAAGAIPARVWGLVAFLVAVYAANLLGPPPPSSAAVAWAALAMWLLVAWAHWADRPRPAAAPA
jgi:hypothetical protein